MTSSDSKISMEILKVKISQDILEKQTAKLFYWISRLRIIKTVQEHKNQYQINEREQGAKKLTHTYAQLFSDKSGSICPFGGKSNPLNK